MGGGRGLEHLLEAALKQRTFKWTGCGLRGDAVAIEGDVRADETASAGASARRTRKKHKRRS